jgi:hypothetical protein
VYYSLSVTPSRSPLAGRNIAAAVVMACLSVVSAAAQSAPPSLTRQQRELLQALVAATDAAGAKPATSNAAWQSHVLRASDGSHYVAFSITPPAATLPQTALVLYVRLATAIVPGETTAMERSIVGEWLQGARTDPRLLPQKRGMAIGEMPALGAGAVGARGPGSVGSSDLQAMALERERSRERKEEEEKRRKAELEGSTVTASDRFPFEDFEVGSATTLADGTRVIQRALTAGPGAYDLYIAWVDASLPRGKAPVFVERLPLRLAPATAEFGLSSLIVADRIAVRNTPLNAIEQRAHPYSLGPTEITPARDVSFSQAERLSIAFQIFNAMPSAAGKPNVVVNPRVVRIVGLREEPVAALTPLTYDAATLPQDFDLRLGHPMIAALAVPLATLRRGDYKLIVTAEDRQSSAIASIATPFTIISTPAGLLAEAPPLAQRLTPAAMLRGATVAPLIDGLAVADPSPAMARAIASARAGRFADLLIEEAVAEDERAARTALTGLALLSVGDLGAVAQFQRALDMGARAAPVRYLLGAALSLQRRDDDAIAAWEKATAEGLPKPITAPLIASTRLARGDAAGAAAAMAATDVTAGDATAAKILAATRIAAQREREAIDTLDKLLEVDARDLEARWLLVRAHYAQLVRGAGDRARFTTEAQRYIDAGGPHAALARDWVAVSFQ